LTKTPQDGEQKNVALSRADFPFLSVNTEATDVVLQPGNATLSEDGKVVTLERMSADGAYTFIETWSLADSPDDYGLKYKVTIRNSGEKIVRLNGVRVECGAIPNSIGGVRKTRMGEAAGGVSYGLADVDKTYSLSISDVTKKMDAEKASKLAAMHMAWVGVHSKYFLMCMQAGWQEGFNGLEANGVADKAAAVANTDPSDPAGKHFHARALLPEVVLEPNGEQSFDIDAYAGPKTFSRLHTLGGNIETVMEMDRFFFGRAHWMGWLSRILLAGMVWISKWFPPSIAYGMGVIFLTIIVKLIFWPLSQRSQASMKKMQALQPQLKELREKYKNDPQKMYAKQQELFKQNNVSQLGGCLPLLLQIPVFFALFNTFRNAIELRMAGFLWVSDLSMPDDLPFTLFGLPIRPWALLMGLSMYFQQKMTPSPDPNQQKMMSFMSLIFIFMFYSLPSALTLYMTVNQILSIVQMLAMRRTGTKDAIVPVAVKGDK